MSLEPADHIKAAISVGEKIRIPCTRNCVKTTYNG